MKKDKLIEVLSAYSETLEARRYSVGRLKWLPHPKEIITEALTQELKDPTFPDMADALEDALIELESFVPDEEFDQVAEFERSVKKPPKGDEAPLPETPPEVHRTYEKIKQRKDKIREDIERMKGG